MLNQKKEYRLNYGGKEVTIETGRIAKQADGSVLVSCNGTTVLVTVCSATSMREGMDFFPLLVEYTEKFYAAGKFLGGFMKREGRPSTQETLNARLIDRPLRPLFPKGYMFETVVSCTVMSYNPAGDPEVLAGIGSSAALSISNIPFEMPIATCKVARIDGKLCINPDREDWEKSDLDILIAGSENAILMVEGEADVVPEPEIIEAINYGHDQIKDMVALIAKMQAEVGVPKREFISEAANETMMKKVESDFSGDARSALNVDDKMERQIAVKAIEAKVKEAMAAAPESFGLTSDDSFGKESYKGVDELLYQMMRGDILKEEKRIAGRKVTEVREIETEVDILQTPHGSSLFTRGETQVLATVTVGGAKGEQMSDRIVGLNYDNFYLHYNFPPYSVGEARGVRGVGRREQGHGNLAQRALKAVMPAKEDFAYTTRICCEVMESNGSSSMGSVCSGSMALMDAGVPLKSPVAGIAMGLITDGTNYKILTDILGDEDHLGDMDFKVAGTADGITALQMDIKIKGLTREIVEESMAQAKEGRLHILGEMAKTISTERKEFKEGVPRILTFNIEPDKIGGLIGPGGKNIKKLQEDFQVDMEVTDDGLVKVIGTNTKNQQDCIDLAKLQLTGPEKGSIYDGTVATIKEYGAFVDIAPGVSGLVHVSEFSNDRVNDPNDYVSEGDVIKVKVVDIDRMGRVKLSAKEVESLPKK
ncbi:MAG: polyribonucleotide nucleotidyltransferase [Halobacteriovoraceae bacterium]|nr:polyribonucleotide nucleotidyltransferase [Halobacteriovoraceae bacterium]MBT5094005.1 polyribonucleotide nucleotidyltransferase [Halobacteriovoraceae bacterium]